MAAGDGILGAECIMYRGTGSYGSSLNAIGNVTDATLNAPWTEANATTRGSYPNEITEPVMRQISFDFTIQGRRDDADFEAIRNAYLNKTPIELAGLDGPDDEAGSQGFHADCKITAFVRGEPLGDFVTYQVTAKPCISANAIEWMEVA